MMNSLQCQCIHLIDQLLFNERQQFPWCYPISYNFKQYCALRAISLQFDLLYEELGHPIDLFFRYLLSNLVKNYLNCFEVTLVVKHDVVEESSLQHSRRDGRHFINSSASEVKRITLNCGV